MKPDPPPADALPPEADERQPTRRQAALFAAKVSVLRVLRAAREASGGRPRRYPPGNLFPTPPGALLAESRTPLYRSTLGAEFALQAGKAHNLRVATARMHGTTVPAGAVFSFWAQVGRPTRRAGFVAGRELREGCVVPSIGGGLCQLSNTLYDAALRAGLEIVERHAHSRRLPGSMAVVGRDATVFWNYVDLRFRAPAGGLRVETILTRTELVVRLLAAGIPGAEKSPHPVVILHPSSVIGPLQTSDGPEEALPGPVVESCETCGVHTCFRHPEREGRATGGVTAWLVDAHWPEFDRYARETRAAGDHLFLPLDGRRFGLGSYAWTTGGYARVRHAPWETLRRSWVSRRLAAQGAARQRALLGFDGALASRYARRLPSEATHLVVSQTLLPFLWRAGALGGRTFDVLMTRLPLLMLQETLDRAAALHPASPTLADFRADPTLAEAEAAALEEAALWITPHSEIARLAGHRAHRLPWRLPAPGPSIPPYEAGRRTVHFPASTLGRKGAYELREIARCLGLRIRLGGAVLEQADFWQGVDTFQGSNSVEPLGAVVLPAWVEPQPRRLLYALSMGQPVIASEACGLAGMSGVTTVPTGDAAALLAAMEECLSVDATPHVTFPERAAR